MDVIFLALFPMEFGAVTVPCIRLKGPLKVDQSGDFPSLDDIRTAQGTAQP
jgi:hypothetical protein